MPAFDIVIRYSGDAQYQPVFAAAADRWEQIIIADIPDVVSSTYGAVDDLLIDASVIAIDGAGGILGQAGPDEFRARSSSFMSIHGEMEFDAADVQQMFANGSFMGVVLHEIGHILGIGTLWSALGLRSGFNYTGQYALAEYRTLSGNPSASSVPLESGGGSGTAGAHWSEAVFDRELMTGYAENGAMPLSTLTVGALRDLGYAVNYGAADAYSLPGGTTTGGGTGATPSPPSPPAPLNQFAAWQIWATGGTASDQAADVNGDGRADLLQLYGGRAYVALSTGAGFGVWTNWFQGVTAADHAVDLNGDGRADVLQLYQGRAIVALSTGSGFGSWSTWGLGVTAGDQTADVNGDGRGDLIQIYNGRAEVALSAGSGFGAWNQWGAGITSGDRLVDVNGDGRDDLLQLYQGRAIVALSNGSVFGAWSDWGTGAASGDQAGDVNGDGRADLIHNAGGRASVALSTGSGFGAWTDWGITGVTSTATPADMNGDNRSDLLQFDQGRALVALSVTSILDGEDMPGQQHGGGQEHGNLDQFPDFFGLADTLPAPPEIEQTPNSKFTAMTDYLVW